MPALLLNFEEEKCGKLLKVEVNTGNLIGSNRLLCSFFLHNQSRFSISGPDAC